MWIKSLYNDTWVSMKHITHFRIVMDDDHYRRGNNLTYAYLNTNEIRMNENTSEDEQNQARVLVCQGSREECILFIDRQQFLEGLFQWIGYLVAGGVGAVLTYLFTKYGLPLP